MLEHVEPSLPNSGLGLSSCTWWGVALLAACLLYLGWMYVGSHVVGRPGGSPITGWMHICWVHTSAGLKYGLCMLYVGIDLGRSPL